MAHSNTLHSLLGGATAALVDVSIPFVPPSLAELAARSDDEILAEQRTLAEIRRRVDATAAGVAAEIARRSRRELGHAGLAQRLGDRTPEKLVQRLSGATAHDAAAMVRVGSLLPICSSHGDPAVESDRPWLAGVGSAVAAGALSLDAADVIRAGLGEPDGPRSIASAGGVVEVSTGVTAEQLAEAARRLVAEATDCTVEQLAVRSRAVRAELDAAADANRVADQEQALRERRYLYITRRDDGMTRLSGLLDPESAALVTSAIDAATSPRRGGPRFVDAAGADRADELVRDRRTTEQIAADTLVELVRLGGAVAPAELLGARPPAVQLLVAERDLSTRRGMAHIEGQTEPVSIQTAERHICESGTVAIVVDGDGEVLALGRETRLFTRRQRLALAARDGGCRFPDCDRPPSWTEAHHIIPWSRGGRSDVSNGILLCRHHHLLLHNNGWAVSRTEDGLAVVPPRAIDPRQTPIPAPSKSRVLERLEAAPAATRVG